MNEMNPAAKKTTAYDAKLGKLIAKRRKSFGLTAEAVSNEIGISGRQLYKYERAVSRLTVKRLEDIGKALGVDAIYFLKQMEEQC